jgi:hypothetical protein
MPDASPEPQANDTILNHTMLNGRFVLQKLNFFTAAGVGHSKN